MTLFTSDIKKKNFITIIIYIFSSIFLVIFNFVYSQFSHGVSSNAMTYAFLYPLFGVVIFTILFFVNWNDTIFYNLFNASIATISIGSLLLGINEIAGADSPFYKYYFIVGVLLMIGSVLGPVIMHIFFKKGSD